jgi:hypothetical protein
VVTRDIRWRLHLKSPPSRVYGFLATDAGRARWWVERSEERDGLVHLHLSSGEELISPIVERAPPASFALRWFQGSEVRFALRADGHGGTDLDLLESGVASGTWTEQRASWVGTLMALKAACDHDVDLRNHDRERTLANGYVDH